MHGSIHQLNLDSTLSTITQLLWHRSKSPSIDNSYTSLKIDLIVFSVLSILN